MTGTDGCPNCGFTYDSHGLGGNCPAMRKGVPVRLRNFKQERKPKMRKLLTLLSLGEQDSVTRIQR